MDGLDYYHLLIDQFLIGDDNSIDVENLNILASGLGDPGCEESLWNSILEKTSPIRSPKKLEAIGIAIFELLADEPACPLWLNSLGLLLGNRAYHWIVIRAYKYSPKNLIRHMATINKEMEKEYCKHDSASRVNSRARRRKTPNIES